MAAAGGDLVEYPMGDSPLRRDLVAGVPSLEDGFVKPSDEPGWGIQIDPRVLEEYGQQHG
jgi:L-alanine-DL-glutamate epimerase-like enolase superfamily enzyme